GSAGSGSEVAAWEGQPLGFGQQHDGVDPACLFVCAPLSGDLPEAGDLEALAAAARFARGNSLPLDVVLPLGDRTALPQAAGNVIAAASPRRIFAIVHPELARFGWKGQLEWLQELWGMYRGDVRWLLGADAVSTLLARFAGQGPPGIDRCWPWLHVGKVADGTGPLRLGSAIFDGAGQAMASPPLQRGLRIVTFAPAAEIELQEKVPAPAAAEVYLYEPHIHYEVAADPVAALLARLGGGELTLESAEYVVDVGYGAGARDDIDALARPLLDLLTDELGLKRAMIGATRKVTQDLETLPVELQIGQTGVRVDPKLVVALGVSGAPQHLDWIGDAAVILSFNTDPDAPLMRLNEQRPRPIVHPIVGDVHKTIPRFIEVLRAKLGG
ncbi:MAG: FAD-binding protein, partial [Acidobacteriota bacterium]